MFFTLYLRPRHLRFFYMKYDFLIWMLLLSGISSAQKYVIVEVDPKLWEGPFVFFSGSINGVSISKTDSLLTIPLAPQFDTIINQGQTILCRMLPGRRYQLKFNPCSSYEFLPINKPKQGMVRTRITGASGRLYNVSVMYPRPILTGKKDRYFYDPPSSMCPFSRKTFKVIDEDEEVVLQYLFHFLHGEKVTLHYNASNLNSSIVIDGYVKGTKYLRTKVYYSDQ